MTGTIEKQNKDGSLRLIGIPTGWILEDNITGEVIAETNDYLVRNGWVSKYKLSRNVGQFWYKEDDVMSGYEKNANSINIIFNKRNSEKELTGKQKNDFIKKAMKMQGYNDKEANQMVNQSRMIGSDWKKVEMTDHDMWDKGHYRISERLDYNPEIYDYDYRNPYYEVLDKITLHRERFDTLDEAMNWVDNRMINQSRIVKSALSGKEWYDYVFNLGYDSYFKNESYKDARDPTWGGEEREAWYNGYSAAMQDERDDKE